MDKEKELPKIQQIQLYCPMCFSSNCKIENDMFKCSGCNYINSSQAFFLISHDKMEEQLTLIMLMIEEKEGNVFLRLLSILERYKLPKISDESYYRLRDKAKERGFADFTIKRLQKLTDNPYK